MTARRQSDDNRMRDRYATLTVSIAMAVLDSQDRTHRNGARCDGNREALQAFIYQIACRRSTTRRADRTAAWGAKTSMDKSRALELIELA